MALVDSSSTASASPKGARRVQQHRDAMLAGQLATVGREYARRYLGVELDVKGRKELELLTNVGYLVLNQMGDEHEAEIRRLVGQAREAQERRLQPSTSVVELPLSELEPEPGTTSGSKEKLSKTTKVRSTPAEAEAWEQVAEDQGLSLSAWVRRTLRDQARYAALKDSLREEGRA